MGINRSRMLRKIRIVLAVLCFTALTLLFLDFTGALHAWLGWLAKIQFLPAVLALHVVIVVALVALTLLFGRIYCSVICPLGVFQDIVSWFSARRKGKKTRYGYTKEIKWLRYGLLAVFLALLVAGVSSLAMILAPYSAWGRIVQNLFAPVYQWGNNLLAGLSERWHNYAFVPKDVWLKSLPTFLIAAATFVAVVVLAWRNGRTWCNTLCPVGTALGFLSRFAAFRPMIDTSKCTTCHACEKHCKASCIDIQKARKHIDYSRCVDCFDCVERCKFGALHYRFARGGAKRSRAQEGQGADAGRRAFLAGTAIALTGTALHARDKVKEVEKKRDGRRADILPKQAPDRSTPITPFGSESIKHFFQHCTACQLCVAVCPNQVLRPSTGLSHFMQPVMSFERGYCRPECVKCSEVCPAGAIRKITPEEKTQWKVGTASVAYDLCIVNRDGVPCGNCARHCPAGAIQMVRKAPDDNSKLRIPTVHEEKCIGCGACENLCPSRPISAITVNGYEVHHLS